jgi:hypothetical protein
VSGIHVVARRVDRLYHRDGAFPLRVQQIFFHSGLAFLAVDRRVYLPAKRFSDSDEIDNLRG